MRLNMMVWVTSFMPTKSQWRMALIAGGVMFVAMAVGAPLVVALATAGGLR